MFLLLKFSLGFVGIPWNKCLTFAQNILSNIFLHKTLKTTYLEDSFLPKYCHSSFGLHNHISKYKGKH